MNAEKRGEGRLLREEDKKEVENKKKGSKEAQEHFNGH